MKSPSYLSRALAIASIVLLARTCMSSDRLPQAPPPRQLPFYTTISGRVIRIEKAAIAIQGFAIDIRGKTRRERSESGRLKVFSVTGDDFRVVGTCGELQAKRLTLIPRVSAEVVTIDDITVRFLRGQEPHRTFLLSDVLTSGGYSTEFGTAFTYCRDDVQADDEVTLELKPSQQYTRICTAISIERRPNREIPPAREQRLRDRYPHSERMQVEQDWEEKGIPYPEKYSWLRTLPR